MTRSSLTEEKAVLFFYGGRLNAFQMTFSRVQLYWRFFTWSNNQTWHCWRRA